MRIDSMIGKIFLTAFSLIFSVSSVASGLREIARPVLVSPQATVLDISCLNDEKCVKKIEEAKAILTQIYHYFNEMLYREDIDFSKFISSEFKIPVDHKSQVFRQLMIGDAEQVILFAIQNFEFINSKKKLRLKVYTILFTEGSLFFVEANAIFTSSNDESKWRLESYDVIGK